MPDFLDDTTSLLHRTPAVLDALLRDLPDDWTGTPDTAGGWRPRDVVGHLVSNELDNFVVRARVILEHGTSRAFEPFDRFTHVERDREASMSELLDRFAELRAENLVELRRLVSQSDLDRRGRHPTFGEVTMRQLLSTWAVHDLDHTAQVFAGLAGSHDGAVGPWKSFLGILLRRDDPSAVPG